MRNTENVTAVCLAFTELCVEWPCDGIGWQYTTLKGNTFLWGHKDCRR